MFRAVSSPIIKRVRFGITLKSQNKEMVSRGMTPQSTLKKMNSGLFLLSFLIATIVWQGIAQIAGPPVGKWD